MEQQVLIYTFNWSSLWKLIFSHHKNYFTFLKLKIFNCLRFTFDDIEIVVSLDMTCKSLFMWYRPFSFSFVFIYKWMDSYCHLADIFVIHLFRNNRLSFCRYLRRIYACVGIILFSIISDDYWQNESEIISLLSYTRPSLWKMFLKHGALFFDDVKIYY